MRAVLAFAALLGLAAGDALAEDAPESQRILECVSDNIPGSPRVIEAVAQSRPLDAPAAATDRIAFEAAVRGRGNRLAISVRVTAPHDLAGSAYLFRQDANGPTLHYYSSELDRVRAIRGGAEEGGIFGSALSLSDFNNVERTMRSASISLRRQREADPAHHRRFTVLPPASAETPFGRIDMIIDSQRCFVIAAEVTDRKGALARRFRVPEEALEQREGGYWYPREIIVEDHVAGRHSSITIDALSLPERLPEARFSPEGFYRRD